MLLVLFALSLSRPPAIECPPLPGDELYAPWRATTCAMLEQMAEWRAEQRWEAEWRPEQPHE